MSKMSDLPCPPKLSYFKVVCKDVYKAMSGHAQFWCECKCGELALLTKRHLDAVKSCGCFRNLQMAGNALFLKHGQARTSSKTPAYRSYMAARTRCNNPNVANYANYGGRGIKFKFASFADFYKELGDRPEKMSLDRIDTNKHYAPGNVQWATRLMQNNNQRKHACVVGDLSAR